MASAATSALAHEPLASGGASPTQQARPTLERRLSLGVTEQHSWVIRDAGDPQAKPSRATAMTTA